MPRKHKERYTCPQCGLPSRKPGPCHRCRRDLRCRICGAAQARKGWCDECLILGARLSGPMSRVELCPRNRAIVEARIERLAARAALKLPLFD